MANEVAPHVPGINHKLLQNRAKNGGQILSARHKTVYALPRGHPLVSRT